VITLQEKQALNNNELNEIDGIHLMDRDLTKQLSRLSLDEKIGQLLMCGFDGTVINAPIRDLISRHHLGGVVIFKRNIENGQQLKNLNAQLQALRTKTHHIPLMIGIDQEGGVVARIESDITYLPGAMALGTVGDMNAIRAIYEATGKELRALGLTVNFAPVADINNNPRNPVIGVRAFGDEPQSVSACVLQAMHGLEAANIAPVVKHFPGHGDTETDSHFGLPTVNHDLARLHAVELAPFKAAIAEGASAIMTAHMMIPALDSQFPATMSQAALTTLLRGELGFEGVIFTDCLEMKAIADHYGVIEGAIKAFEAGADVMLISHTPALQMGFIKAMKVCVAKGEISEKRIDESIRRIVAFKQRYAMAQIMDAPLCEPNAMRLAERLSQQSVQIFKDEGKQLPLSADRKTLVIMARIQTATEIEALSSDFGTLAWHLKQVISTCDALFIHPKITAIEAAHVLARADEYEQIVIMSYNAILQPTQAELINTLAQRHPHLVVVAGRLPYDIQALPKVNTYLSAFDNRPLSMKSISFILMHGHYSEPIFSSM
jgi:beta-N-acetylhexosaminidase